MRDTYGTYDGRKPEPPYETGVDRDAEALRLRAEKAEAELAQLAARLAEIEKGSWGRVTDDDESGYPSFDDWFDAVGCDPLCDWTDGAIVTWERFGPLPSERYRILRHVDADGCVSYTYEKENDRA